MARERGYSYDYEEPVNMEDAPFTPVRARTVRQVLIV